MRTIGPLLFSRLIGAMMRQVNPAFHFLFLLIFTLHSLPVHSQSVAPLLPADRVIDWSHAGVGEIPSRTQLCARLTSSASLQQINAALRGCPQGQTVFLEPGTYAVPGTIDIPSEVTLRGAGADRTILNATGTSHGYVVRMGSGTVPFTPIRILNGASANSTEITLAIDSHVMSGQFLVIAEDNDPAFVTAQGSEGNCTWCDGWTKTGSMARGQIVQVVAVEGKTVRIAPALYSEYTHSPIVVPFRMAAQHTGVEDLQVYANNTGYEASFGMVLCAWCWVRGVESNYSDGDYVEVFWGFHDEVRDSYFSNSYVHVPGEHDTGIHVAYKTSASRIENNIVERGRVAFSLGWGEAGNVFAYNFTTAEFASEAPKVVSGGLRFHGAHVQFNLFEGNVTAAINMDAVWGSSSHLTAFRNWLLGTTRVCAPLHGRAPVVCGASAQWSFVESRAIHLSCLGTRSNFAGNILGSAPMQSLIGNGEKLAQVPAIEFPSVRSNDHAAYGWAFGYSDFAENGRPNGCFPSLIPYHASATDQMLGNYNNIDHSIHWANGLPRPLPASLYLSTRPAWWKHLPFPAIGPDVHGGGGPGGHSYGNPAERCYRTTMGGKEGGEGSPYRFNAATCYSVGH